MLLADRPVPHLPRWMVAKAWGVGADLMEKYIAFDEEGRCAVGGDKCIQVMHTTTFFASILFCHIIKNQNITYFILSPRKK